MALSPDQNLQAVSNISTGFDIYNISLDTKCRDLRSESHITTHKNCLPVLFIINNGAMILSIAVGWNGWTRRLILKE